MKLLAWFKFLFTGPTTPAPAQAIPTSSKVPLASAEATSNSAAGRVPFFDVTSRRVVHIPPAELRPAFIQARVEGVDGVVWVLPEQLMPGDIRHPPFDENIRNYIRDIQAAFAEHLDMSFEAWEEGFRRDANPAKEIALFVHAGGVYRRFADDEPSPERRAEIYRLLVACMTTSPDSVWHVVKLASLSRPEAERIVRRFYGGENAETA